MNRNLLGANSGQWRSYAGDHRVVLACAGGGRRRRLGVFALRLGRHVARRIDRSDPGDPFADRAAVAPLMSQSGGLGIRARWLCLRAFSRRVRSTRNSVPWSRQESTQMCEVGNAGTSFGERHSLLSSGTAEPATGISLVADAFRRVYRIPLHASRELVRIAFPGALVAACVPCLHEWFRKLSDGMI